MRDAASGKGNFGLGSGTRAEADRLGRAWVRDGYKVASDGKTLISKDGLRQYRPPSYKGRLDKTQPTSSRNSQGKKQEDGNLTAIWILQIRAMKAELKRVHSPDVDDLSNYQPEEPECFAFLLQAMIGPRGEDWAESFDIEVCTPKWIEKTFSQGEVVIGRHHFIVREYSYENIIRTINKYLMHCSGEDWSEVATRVSRLGRWEFEDYSD